MTKRPWLAVSTLAIAAALATRLKPGPLPDGSTLLPSGWRIRPAGRQVTVGTLPLGLATLSDGSVLVTNNGYAENGLMRVDPGAAAVTRRQPLAAAWVGLARTGTDGHDTVWVSGAGTNRVYRFTRRAVDWAVDTATLADATQQLFVGGIAPVPRGLVAAVGNLSDSVYLLDAATLARRATVAVGHRPYTAVADSTHLYVSDWGDSTVSIIDLSATNPPLRRSALFVGPHPSALALRGGDLFVALAGSNGLARVDIATGRVVEQLTVALAPHAPVGSDPNALALSPDGRTLYVAMAGNNAVAVVHLRPTTMRVAGLIPAGWYPTAVAVAADGKTLFVANGKGAGSAANPDGKYIGNVITGSVSIVPVPDATTLARYTREVYALSPYSNAALRGVSPNRLTGHPPIRHVVYIIRENRTYDQVFGDVWAGNGDRTLAIFNDSVTPNAHAIARRWVLFDNFYVDGEVSADGHEWTDRAFAGDYNEKTWPLNYSKRRPWDFTSGEDLANPRDAYLWDAAKRKGLWVVNFGEMTESESEEGDTGVARRVRTNI